MRQVSMPEKFYTRLVSFKQCTNPSCNHSAELHLIANTKLAVLEQNTAIAVSYAWGQFARKQRRLGHFQDGTQLNLELGEEWNLVEFCNSLYSLCLRADGTEGWLWIDQVCIDQTNNEDFRQTLARIPDIFRTFEVCVLLPGSPCKCFKSDQVDDVVTAETKPEIRDRWRARSCVNLLVLHSWATRVWTRQELIYARKFQVRWMQPSQVCCVKTRDLPQTVRDETELEDFELSHSVILSLRTVHDSEDRFEAFRYRAHALVRQTLWNLECTLSDWLLIHQGWTTAGQTPEIEGMIDARMNLLRSFLTEQEVQAKSWSDTGSVTGKDSSTQRGQASSDVLQFVALLYTLHSQERHATRPRDYVLSVWVDCRGYQIPNDFQHRTATELFQNALQQLRTRHGLTLTSNTPQALFAHSNEPLVWQPKLNTTTITRISDLYGAFDPAHFISPPQLGLGQLIEFCATTSSIRNDMSSFEGIDPVVLLRDSFASWEPQFPAKIADTLDAATLRSQTSSLTEDDEWTCYWLSFLNKNLMGEMPDSALTNLKSELAEADKSIDDLVYDLICVAAGLSPGFAKHAGVKLMTQADPPMLGLTRFDFDAMPDTLNGAFSIRMCLPAEWLTRPAARILQCSVRAGVIGIWIPTAPSYDRRTASDVHTLVLPAEPYWGYTYLRGHETAEWCELQGIRG